MKDSTPKNGHTTAKTLFPRTAFRKREETDQEGWMVAYADMITLLFIFFTLLLSISTVNTTKLDIMSTQWSEKSSSSLSQIAEDVKAQIAQKNLEELISVELSSEGLRVSFSERVLFGSGEAHLNPEGERVLGDFAVALKNMTTKYQIAIEGHTDSQPIHTAAFASNWSLSSARAVNVLHFLTARGVSDRAMSIRSFADTRPLPSKNGTSDMARNRRVSLLIY